ncbi:hypothetical protein B0H12DRAFT_1148412 [Mycena haematopus]|nr:hypothetical protein B0H12DRAFT_1148412 [Mycena haematopus]
MDVIHKGRAREMSAPHVLCPIYDRQRSFRAQVPTDMGHGPGPLALVLKLYLALSLAQGALALEGPRPQSQFSTSSEPFSSASASASTSSAFGQSLSQLASSSLPSSTQSSSSSSSHTRHFTSTTASDDFVSSTDSTATNSTSLPDPFTSPTPSSLDPTSSPPLPPPSDTSSEVARSTSIAVLSSSHSNNHVPIIAGVVAPVCLILLAAVAFVLHKRRRRSRDRREWERTHEAIADAVRQVGSPVPRNATPYAGSGVWSHLDRAKGSGDTVTNPFTDAPVAHQSAEQSAAIPFRPVRSPTFRAAHSPALSHTYSAFNVQDGAEPPSRQSTVESVQFDASYGPPGDHAI